MTLLLEYERSRDVGWPGEVNDSILDRIVEDDIDGFDCVCQD